MASLTEISNLKTIQFQTVMFENLTNSFLKLTIFMTQNNPSYQQLYADYVPKF